MKHLKNTLIPLMVLVLLISACSKADEPPATSPIMKQVKWKVSYYGDNGANETNAYTGYVFTFNSNGNVTAVKGTSTVNGTWSPGTKESDNKLILNFNSIFLEGLNAQWSFTEKSYSIVKMESVNGTNDTDILVLEQI